MNTEEKRFRVTEISRKIIELEGKELFDKLFEYGYTSIAFEKIERPHIVCYKPVGMRITTENKYTGKLHSIFALNDETSEKLSQETTSFEDLWSSLGIRLLFYKHLSAEMLKVLDRKH